MVHLGFTIPNGEPVEIPIGHMVVSGMTQKSGKTTTLEALISRSGSTALAFLTKRGEGRFNSDVTVVAPFFKERADWQYVSSILEAAYHKKMHFERAWIMRMTDGARTLEDVRKNCKRLMEGARNEMSKDMYMVLGKYLDEVIPQLKGIPRKEGLDLSAGLNVMDLTMFNEETQMMLMSSALDYIFRKLNNVITVLPEAWKFAPQGRNTPVKMVVERIAREGAALHNFLWIDSQDLAGVEKILLRGCSVWLMGVQREINEVHRSLKSMTGLKKPKPEDITGLRIGQFVLCDGDEVKKVYVQPAWMDRKKAQSIAIGKSELDKIEMLIEFGKSEFSKTETPERSVLEEEDMGRIQELEEENRELRDRIAQLEAKRVEKAESIASPEPAETNRVTPPTMEPIYDYVLARLKAEQPKVLAISSQKLDIELTERVSVIEMDSRTPQGMTAKMIADGLLDEPFPGQKVFNYLQSHNISVAKPGVYKMLREVFVSGGLMRENMVNGKAQSFELLPGAKSQIKRK